MSNTVNQVNFSIPFATFLTLPTTDASGTWNDVLETLKVDEPGQEATAPEIAVAAGQLWSNLLDDFVEKVWDALEGATVYEVDTTDDTPVLTTIASLTSDGDSIFIRGIVTARDTATPGKVIELVFGGTYYRSGGVISVIGLVGQFNQVGFTSAFTFSQVTGDDIQIEVEGEVATNISWDIRITEARPLR